MFKTRSNLPPPSSSSFKSNVQNGLPILNTSYTIPLFIPNSSTAPPSHLNTPIPSSLMLFKRFKTMHSLGYSAPTSNDQKFCKASSEHCLFRNVLHICDAVFNCISIIPIHTILYEN